MGSRVVASTKEDGNQSPRLVRRVIIRTCETDGELQRWAELIFNTNSAQFGLAMISLLPAASAAVRKRVPTSSAKISRGLAGKWCNTMRQ